MQVHQDKSNVVHFQKQSQPRTTVQFNCGQHRLKTVDSYKYLGCILDQTLDFIVIAKVLAGAASCTLGDIIANYHKAGGLTYEVHKQLYETCVIPIMDCCAGVWGYKQYDKHNTVHNRAIKSYLGVCF